MPLFAELKRRNVFRVAAAYAVVGWLLVEVASVVLPTFDAPSWVMKVFTFLVILGFPLALVFAWAFELTPEGIKREKDVEPGTSITRQTGRKLDFAIIGLLALAVVYFAVDKFMLGREPQWMDSVSVPVAPLPTGDSAAPEKSIAVLPFDNISPDPKDAYFADGVQDEVLAQLSKIRDLKVISRTSVMRYRGESRPSLPEIAAALGVANILEGSVRIAGNRVRITTQLIEADRDAHLWAETYDRELTAANIFSVQSEIATTVAAALRASLSPEEQDRIATLPTDNLAAYQAYLLGKQGLAKLDKASLDEAVGHFQHAVELDSNFALAYVGLADTYAWLSEKSDQPPEEMLAKAQSAVNNALALDDRLGEAYNSIAGIKQGLNDYEGAEVAYRRALELNPSYATAYFWYGTLLARRNLDRPAEALPLLVKAVELEPLSTEPMLDLGETYLELGRPDEALRWFQRIREVDPSSPAGYIGFGLYHEYSGRLDEAYLSTARGVALHPGDTLMVPYLAALSLALGDIERAEYWGRLSLEFGPELFWPNIVMYMIYLNRREEAAGVDYARKAFALWPIDYPALSLLRYHEVTAGRYAEARALYEETYPGLLADDPMVKGRNWQEAIDLALVLQKMGEEKRADLLLRRSLEYIQTLPLRGAGYEIAEAMIYALQGEKEQALSELRQAIDEGWRSNWRYDLLYDWNLASLHDEPEYQAMVAEIEADMAAQLEHVREMERNGELEPISEVPTASK